MSNRDGVRNLLEGRFIDAIQAIGATFTKAEFHFIKHKPQKRLRKQSAYSTSA